MENTSPSGLGSVQISDEGSVQISDCGGRRASWTGPEVPRAIRCGETFGLANRRAAVPRGDGGAA